MNTESHQFTSMNMNTDTFDSALAMHNIMQIFEKYEKSKSVNHQIIFESKYQNSYPRQISSPLSLGVEPIISPVFSKHLIPIEGKKVPPLVPSFDPKPIEPMMIEDELSYAGWKYLRNEGDDWYGLPPGELPKDNNIRKVESHEYPSLNTHDSDVYAIEKWTNALNSYRNTVRDITYDYINL